MSKNIRRKRKTKTSKTTGSDDNPFIDVPAIASTQSESQKNPQRTGTVYQLSDSMRKDARELAATGLYVEDYDNININFRSGEQIIGRHDTQENGTAATIAPLFDANIEDMNLKEFQKAYLDAPPLKLEDIILLGDDQKRFQKNLIFCILRIIIKYGGPGFLKFEKDLQRDQPSSSEKIPTHQTELHPLPSWPIDESSIIGNAEVDKAVVNELQLDDVPEFSERVRIVGGDQLSIARMRALEYIRAGQEEGYEGYFWGAWMPGLFHAKIADAHGTLLNHLGKPDRGAQNPGSLAFHNARLDRLPITATSLPTFRTCRAIIFVSLYARVLHCLLLVSKYSSLEEYSTKVNDWQTVINHATQIFKEYANASRVEKLRSDREKKLKDAPKGAKPTTGDAVFENGCLFLRDALISREFNDAIKCGDSGRIVLVLKTWALSFRGNGRTKYAYEMLHLIHNLTSAWPPGVRDIMLKNWVANPTGEPNRFVEMDLVQEHLNYKIKVAYKARGSNASWEWLETISPCVVALSDLQKAFNDKLGGEQGLVHAEPDLKEDIQSLIDLLIEYKVYYINLGRILDDDEITKEVIGGGLKNLTAGEKNPLSDFNSNKEKLQERRRMVPVTANKPESTDEPPTSTPKIPDNPSEPPQPTATHPTSSSPPIPEGQSSSTAVNLDSALEQDKTEVADNDEEAVNGQTELDLILRDLEQGLDEPTLPRMTEDDVAYEMDEVIVEVEVSDEDSESGSGSEDGSDGESDE